MKTILRNSLSALIPSNGFIDNKRFLIGWSLEQKDQLVVVEFPVAEINDPAMESVMFP